MIHQKESIGFGAIKNLNVILKEEAPQRIFLVTGKNSYETSGARRALDPILESYDVTRFYDFEQNPKIEDIRKGIEIFRRKNPDLVVAIGGGSVIDIAKSINLFSTNKEDPLNYIGKRKEIEKKGKPFVAIPTTAGAGNEATPFAVVYVGKEKNSVEHANILPKYVILDPTFTSSLSPRLTAITGIDALSQAIEAYWSIRSTEQSKKWSRGAIKIALGNLEKAVKNPDQKSRFHMLRASNLAGKAITISKTTTPHAMSYILTSYFGIPHGHAVGLTLGNMLLYNSMVTEKDVNDPRGVLYVQETIKELSHWLETQTPKKAKDKINLLVKNIGLETSMTELGIDSEEGIQLIMENINLERMANNPRKISSSELKKILKQIA